MTWPMCGAPIAVVDAEAADARRRSRKAAVWVDPGRMGGKPCIYGHRLTTRAITALVRDGGVALVKDLYPYLDDDQILDACWYEGTHGRSKKLRRWYREWTTEP